MRNYLRCAFSGTIIDNSNVGKTDLVEWDRSSLYIRGERVYVFSGEFHYPRLPVPEVWLDIFQKLRATGFNAVSIYFFWAYHSPSPDTMDFTTAALDIQRLFEYATEAGIWIITRAGPYINAETSAGGVALWTTTGAWGKHRTGDEKHHQAWLPFVTEVGKIFAKNSIVNGGPAILNQHEKWVYIWGGGSANRDIADTFEVSLSNHITTQIGLVCNTWFSSAMHSKTRVS